MTFNFDNLDKTIQEIDKANHSLIIFVLLAFAICILSIVGALYCKCALDYVYYALIGFAIVFLLIAIVFLAYFFAHKISFDRSYAFVKEIYSIRDSFQESLKKIEQNNAKRFTEYQKNTDVLISKLQGVHDREITTKEKMHQELIDNIKTSKGTFNPSESQQAIEIKKNINPQGIGVPSIEL